MKKFGIFLVLLVLTGNAAFAQKEKLYTNKGNQALKRGNIQVAREAYQRALDVNPNYHEAQFNLGNTYQIESRVLYNEIENQPNEALQQAMLEQAATASERAASEYEKLVNAVNSDEQINKLQYNLGNARVYSGQIRKGIEAYKEALRKDPTDEDARYNLAYALHLLKQQEQEQQQQQDDQQDQQQQEDQQKQKNKDEQQEPQGENEQEQPLEDQLSKEDAEKMLDALTKQEKDLQDQLNKKKTTVQPIKIEKNW